MVDEKQLLELLRSDSKLTLDVYFKNWSACIYFCSLSLTNSPDASKRIVIDVFVKLWQNRSHIKHTCSLETLFRSYIIQCINNDYYGFVSQYSYLENEVRLENIWDMYPYQTDFKENNKKILEQIEKDLGNTFFFNENVYDKKFHSIVNVRLYHVMMKIFIVFLPFIFFFVVYLYFKKSNVDQNMLLISTGINQSVCITLPDGSKIMMDGESELQYNPANYVTHQREIYFNGTADINVTRAKDIFTLFSDNVKIQTDMSNFKIFTDKNSDNTSFCVRMGDISVTSLSDNYSCCVNKGEKAIFNKENGCLSIKDGNCLQGKKKITHSVP